MKPIFQKAAEKGNSEAQFYPGVSYIFTVYIYIYIDMHAYTSIHVYVSIHLSLSISIFQKAAEKGNSEAQFNLGVSYTFTVGIYRYRYTCMHTPLCMYIYPSISIYLSIYVPESRGKGKLRGTVQPWGELYGYGYVYTYMHTCTHIHIFISLSICLYL